MNQKTLVIAVVAVVVIAVVVAGVYLATRGGGGPTPTPTPTATPTGVEGASSLQFTVDVTSEGVTHSSTYMAKNIGTSSMMIRIEITTSDGDYTYIVNGAQQTAWGYAGGEWTDLSSTFSDQWSSWNSTWTGYESNLLSWTGSGDYTYTAPNGDSVRVYGITVNPTLANSLFEHS